ncbi:hypothetical protein HELRODRAFT_168390 [Helobdella robusta]|uniref:Uncharacterized protein n=1 Tax=Helobdella robusta TaxID=6412 RepID=T1F0J1_HELRO|nr:hypothetical protein HELRODRAFT_168390 [Helobdella robusta]ESO09407.1 hypothetical protein HELRODRAFT_168390 [Helobdella robusta]
MGQNAAWGKKPNPDTHSVIDLLVHFTSIKQAFLLECCISQEGNNVTADVHCSDGCDVRVMQQHGCLDGNRLLTFDRRVDAMVAAVVIGYRKGLQASVELI